MSDIETNDAKEEQKVSIKRGPGRPRRTPVRQPKPKNGIVTTPTDARHYIEFLFDKPLIFKKLWQFFKLMAVDRLHLSFDKENITIYCSDHHKKSNIRVKINCNEVNHYFCENELDIGLSCKNPELIMSTIDKTYNSILFLSSKDNIQKNIQVVLKNDIDIEEAHKIELIGEYDRIENQERFSDENYVVKFNLPGKYFKKMISDIKTFSDQLTIRQDSHDDNLMFEYIKNDKKIKSLYTIKNNNSINLKSNLVEDDTFRTSIKIDYIRPISSALLSENITIYADENKPMMFIINMDPAVEMRILTQIVDNRDV